MKIRRATSSDKEGVRDVYLSAFSEAERQLVSGLAVELLTMKSAPGVLSLVAEMNGRMVGHVAFSPLSVVDDDTVQGYILAPLAVEPSFQKQQIGTALIENGMDALSKLGVHIVLVYGDPNYYSQFGFSRERAMDFTPQYTLQYPLGWQAAILHPFPRRKQPSLVDCVAPLNRAELW